MSTFVENKHDNLFCSGFFSPPFVFNLATQEKKSKNCNSVVLKSCKP